VRASYYSREQLLERDKFYANKGGLFRSRWRLFIKRGFHPTQRMQRTQRKEGKERNEMASLLDYGISQSQPPATTAYADGTVPSCGRHTHKILNYWNQILFASQVAEQVKKRSEIWIVDFVKNNLNLKNLSSAGKMTARFLLAGACDSCVSCVYCVHWVACVAFNENPAFDVINSTLKDGGFVLFASLSLRWEYAPRKSRHGSVVSHRWFNGSPTPATLRCRQHSPYPLQNYCWNATITCRVTS